jgi:dTDP-4-dehydrorhamnose 3,5-epimerase
VPIEQMNFSIVDVEGHIKGLHYHLKQDDIWFVPPPSKAKFVLYDVRQGSPTFGKTQVIVAGGGQDVLVRIPAGVAHGYRPLTNPCALLYFVTKSFDPEKPDELRIPWDHPAVKDLWDVPNG